MTEIVCRTGSPRTDEMGASLIRNAAESAGFGARGNKQPSAHRIVLTFREEDASPEDILILLYRGEQPPQCTRPRSAVLRAPYAITALEETVRRLLTAGEGCGEAALESVAPAEETAEPVLDGRRVSLGEMSVQLTPTEAALFAVLYENRGKAVPRESLEQAVWGREVAGNLCDVYVCRLRTALRPIFGNGFLVNLRKDGYKMV